jgi:High potential iron-sulfur protein
MPSAHQKSVSRRSFIVIIPVVGLGMLAACSPKTEPASAPPPMTSAPPPDAAPSSSPTMPASALPMLDEKDPQAITLGYVEDSSKADKSKFPVSVASSTCSNCALYTGNAGEISGPCTIFPGKKVMAAGWCNSWAKKT